MKENCKIRECVFCKEQFFHLHDTKGHTCEKKCFIEGCEKTYANINSLRKHVVEKHYENDKTKWKTTESYPVV